MIDVQEFVSKRQRFACNAGTSEKDVLQHVHAVEVVVTDRVDRSFQSDSELEQAQSGVQGMLACCVGHAAREPCVAKKQDGKARVDGGVEWPGHLHIQAQGVIRQGSLAGPGSTGSSSCTSPLARALGCGRAKLHPTASAMLPGCLSVEESCRVGRMSTSEQLEAD